MDVMWMVMALSSETSLAISLVGGWTGGLATTVSFPLFLFPFYSLTNLRISLHPPHQIWSSLVYSSTSPSACCCSLHSPKSGSAWSHSLVLPRLHQPWYYLDSTPWIRLILGIRLTYDGKLVKLPPVVEDQDEPWIEYPEKHPRETMTLNAHFLSAFSMVVFAFSKILAPMHSPFSSQDAWGIIGIQSLNVTVNLYYCAEIQSLCY